MSGRLAQLNKLESELFKEYIEIRDEEEPDTIQTPNGEFNNLDWVESEVDAVSEERDRIEYTSTLDGGTIDVN